MNTITRTIVFTAPAVAMHAMFQLADKKDLRPAVQSLHVKVMPNSVRLAGTDGHIAGLLAFSSKSYTAMDDENKLALAAIIKKADTADSAIIRKDILARLNNDVEQNVELPPSINDWLKFALSTKRTFSPEVTVTVVRVAQVADNGNITDANDEISVTASTGESTRVTNNARMTPLNIESVCHVLRRDSEPLPQMYANQITSLLDVNILEPFSKANAVFVKHAKTKKKSAIISVSPFMSLDYRGKVANPGWNVMLNKEVISSAIGGLSVEFYGYVMGLRVGEETANMTHDMRNPMGVLCDPMPE